MRRASLLFCTAVMSPAAMAQIPSSVLNSCVLAEDYGGATFREFSGIATLIEDEIPGYFLLHHRHKGVRYGYASSVRDQPDLLVVGRQFISIRSARHTGKDVPATFDPTQAFFGIIRFKARDYYCVVSTFEGLGRSGSFQNIHPAYIAPLVFNGNAPKMSALYYTVRDIRKIVK